MHHHYSTFLLLFLLLFSSSAFGQSKVAFKIYDKKGKKVKYKKLLKKAKKQDIILFGEIHNNPISHWLELELAKDLNNNNSLTLGAEMIETDNQSPLNDYLKGKIDYFGLDTLARLWSNYKTDYAPLVDLAKENNIPFIGTNIPRRFASNVFNEGDFGILDQLTDEEKSWVAPLPIPFDPELPQYKKILIMMGDHGSPELVKAQAIKDATMAHFILKHFQPGHIFLHFNGAFHSDFFEGILWYLKNENSNLNYLTITTVSQKDIHRLEKEHKGRADFIICVDEDMTTTY